MRRTTLGMLLAITVATPAPAGARLRVVATTPTLAALADAVGGDAVEVTALSLGAHDPHFVDAKPNLLVALHRADLLVRVGLDLEAGWLPRLVASARNGRIQPGAAGDLDAAAAIEPLDVRAHADRAQGDIHPRGNPHHWLDPENGRRIARALAGRIAQLAPATADAVRARLAAFEADLDARVAAWRARLAPLAGRPFVSQHKSFTYFARFAGLVEAGFVEPKPGVPPSPSHLAGLIDACRRARVPAVWIEPFYSRDNAELVARRCGAKLLVMPTSVGARPELRGYPELIDAIVTTAVAATGR